MGNNQSDGQNTFDTHGYSKISDREDDSIYGEIEIWNKNENPLIKLAVSNNILHDEDHFAQAKEACDQASKLSHESVVQLNSVIANKQEEFCSTFYQISLLYEYLEVNLKNDISQRFNVNQQYNEDELWHILVSVITALAYLKQQGYQHSDIRPSSILINYEGKVKIMQRSWFQKKQDSYVEIITGTQSNRGVYLSPKLILNLKDSMLVPQHDTFKTDIYTLALTLIECAQLSPLVDIYDLKRFTINNQVIKNSLQQIAARYSKQFVEFLSLMLEDNEAQRPQIEELFQQLKNLFDQGVKMSDRLYTLNTNDRQYTVVNTQQNQTPQYVQVQQSPSPQKIENITPAQQEDELHPMDAEHKKVKRSKKCKTDDHDKAKLSKQPVVEGLDPRKQKEYVGNIENDINRFHDESVENKKIKRKKAFNTDDHDQATLTKEPEVGGVDPRKVGTTQTSQTTTQYVQKTYITSTDKYPVTASFKSSSQSKIIPPPQQVGNIQTKTQTKNF